MSKTSPNKLYINVYIFSTWAIELDIGYIVEFIGKVQKMACSLSSNPIPRHIIYKNALRRDLHKHVLRIQNNFYFYSIDRYVKIYILDFPQKSRGIQYLPQLNL